MVLLSERIVERARGRPKGKFTQHRRLDRLREILEKHPRGISLYDLADALSVTVRSMVSPSRLRDRP